MEKITGSSSAITEKQARSAVTLLRFIAAGLLVLAAICVAMRAEAEAKLLSAVLDTPNTYAAGRDRKPPSTPTNLRVTNRTSFSVSLAWNPSTDDSGSFSYRVRHSGGFEATVPGTQTNFTVASNLEAGHTYSFYVFAIDAAGNRSGNSNTVSVTLPRDTIPPTAPVVSVTDVGPTHVSLSWSSTDDGPFVFYTIFKNGTRVIQGTSSTSGNVYLLEPETTYTFTAQARDNGINWSPISEPVTVTTRPRNPNDTTPPATPTNLQASVFDNGETHLTWNQSTDDFDPQTMIRYDTYLNGVLVNSTVGQSRTIFYGVDGSNTISVIAVDTAGNQSAPVTITIVLDF